MDHIDHGNRAGTEEDPHIVKILNEMVGHHSAFDSDASLNFQVYSGCKHLWENELPRMSGLRYVKTP